MLSHFFGSIIQHCVAPRPGFDDLPIFFQDPVVHQHRNRLHSEVLHVPLVPTVSQVRIQLSEKIVASFTSLVILIDGLRLSGKFYPLNVYSCFKTNAMLAPVWVLFTRTAQSGFMPML